MKRLIVEFIELWGRLTDGDRLNVFGKILGGDRMSLQRVRRGRVTTRSPIPPYVPPPEPTWAMVTPPEGGRTIQQVIGEPLIIGGWKD